MPFIQDVINRNIIGSYNGFINLLRSTLTLEKRK